MISLHLFKSRVLFLSGILFVSLCAGSETLAQPFGAGQDALTSLTHAVSERDSEALWQLKDHENPFISNNAWRALITAKTEDTDAFTSYAIEADEPLAWYVLSFQEPDERNLESVKEKFKRGEIGSGACELFYRHGDADILAYLMSDEARLQDNGLCSKAVGGILTRVELEAATIDDIVSMVMRFDDETAIRNVLYGFWRSELNRPAEDTSAYKMLTEMVYSRTDGEPQRADEYLVSITGEIGFDAAMHHRPAEHIEKHVQFAVVTAAAMSRLDAASVDTDLTGQLLRHSNAHVTVRTLESLKVIEGLDIQWILGLQNQIPRLRENPEAGLAYLELLNENGQDLSGKKEWIESIHKANPYLKDRTLALYKTLLDEKQFLSLLEDLMADEGIEAMRAAQQLSEFAEGYEHPHELRDLVRGTLTGAMEHQNRSVLSVSGALLQNRHYFNDEDAEQFEEAFQAALQNGYYSTAGLIAETAKYHEINTPVFDTEIPQKSMRLPDWQRLDDLGSQALWKLETNRGDVLIKLKPDSAPFTVSSIDALTRTGEYDGTALHRVVRNFVVQGGDFDRRDGFGGPDYRLPTEPSFESFTPGMAGIASSGPDTEGSQFFITHTWTPHLDGLYTIFGEVIEGMDVVENIQIGDIVLQATIIIR